MLNPCVRMKAVSAARWLRARSDDAALSAAACSDDLHNDEGFGFWKGKLAARSHAPASASVLADNRAADAAGAAVVSSRVRVASPVAGGGGGALPGTDAAAGAATDAATGAQGAGNLVGSDS